jgi:prefoldin subunit 5
MMDVRIRMAPDETAEDYDLRIQRLNEEIDDLEEAIVAGSQRLALLRQQTEVLKRAAHRGDRPTQR